MTHYWAIAIGINQYQYLQPLAYAERDAQTLHQMLVEEAGFAPEYCLLLSDLAPVTTWGSSTPNRETLQTAIATVIQRLQPDDVLWIFFSGYGAQQDGQDYLVPLDGDPLRLSQTAIALDWLFSLLQAAPTPNVLLLLDVNRNQGMLAGTAGAGTQTLALAQQYGIATILSCLPEQYSHETLALRQGLFTTALMEALRDQRCMTLEHLGQFLRDRLPQLSEHHWRPRQDPAVLIPDSQRYQLIVPGKTTIDSPPPASQPLVPPQLPIMPVGSASAEQAAATAIPTPAAASGSTTNSPSQTAPPVPDDPVEARSWKRFLQVGGGLLSALLALVLVRNIETVTTPPLPPDGAAIAQSSPPSDPPPADSLVSQAPSAGDAPIALPDAPPNTLRNPTANAIAPPPAPAPSVAAETPDPAGESRPASDFFSQLLRPGSPAPAPTAAGDVSIMNQAMATLSKARLETPSNQVSEIAEAIELLRQINRDQPLYADAQATIDRWSAFMLDMARGRAAQRNGGDSLLAARNFTAAIAAARMVPGDRGEISAEAQRSIAEWSQQLLALANLSAELGDLPLAIQVAQQVPTGTAAFDPAQQAIASWRARLQRTVG